MEERFATGYLICFTIIFVVEAQRGFMEEETASLTGDVQNWAVLLQNYILQVCVFQNLTIDINYIVLALLIRYIPRSTT